VEKGGLEEERAFLSALAAGRAAPDVAAAVLRLLRESQPARESQDDADLNLAMPAETGKVRLMVTAGRLENVRRMDLVGAITGEAGLTGEEIGAVEVLAHSSFVEVPANRVEDVVRALTRTRIRGRRVRVEREGHKKRRDFSRFKPGPTPRKPPHAGHKPHGGKHARKP
jgi:ATP-dependent RNA helicase DeaD